MRITRKLVQITGGVVIGVGLIGATLGSALAADPTPIATATPGVATTAPNKGDGNGLFGRGFERGFARGYMTGAKVGNLGGEIQQVADLLKLTPAQIAEKRQAGQSLVQIAKEQNVSEQQLVDVLLAAHKTRLDTAVKNGRLTQAQADEGLKQMETRIRASINSTAVGPKNGGAVAPGAGRVGKGMAGRQGNCPAVAPTGGAQAPSTSTPSTKPTSNTSRGAHGGMGGNGLFNSL